MTIFPKTKQFSLFALFKPFYLFNHFPAIEPSDYLCPLSPQNPLVHYTIAADHFLMTNRIRSPWRNRLVHHRRVAEESNAG